MRSTLSFCVFFPWQLLQSACEFVWISSSPPFSRGTIWSTSKAQLSKLSHNEHRHPFLAATCLFWSEFQDRFILRHTHTNEHKRPFSGLLRAAALGCARSRCAGTRRCARRSTPPPLFPTTSDLHVMNELTNSESPKSGKLLVRSVHPYTTSTANAILCTGRVLDAFSC